MQFAGSKEESELAYAKKNILEIPTPVIQLKIHVFPPFRDLRIFFFIFKFNYIMEDLFKLSFNFLKKDANQSAKLARIAKSLKPV